LLSFYYIIVEGYFALSSCGDNDNDGDDGRCADHVGDSRYDRDDAYVHGRDENRIGERDPFVEILERYSFLDSLIFSFRLLVNSYYVYE
jgi:hypothetical protein